MEIQSERKLCFQKNEKSMKLPGCLLYCRGGMIPHLTKDNLEMITTETENIACQLPLSTVYQQPGLDVMEAFGKSFHKFSNSEDKIYFLNINDTYNDKPDMYSYNEEKSVSIWVPGGRRKVTPDEYMKYLQTFKFDICIAPSDNIPEGCTKKRCSKSVNRTIKFLDRCIEIKKEKQLDIPIFGVLEGGDNQYDRDKCAKEVAKRDVDGYVISGFDRISNDWNELLQCSLNHLEKGKIKMMLGVLTPLEVLDAVKLGVYLFDSVIAYNASERNCALCFKYNLKKKHVEKINASKGSLNVNGDDENDKEKNSANKLTPYEFCLRDKKYFDDTSPLVDGCPCYCCVRYTRSYLHHLLVTNEMLAPVLLMIHNLHHWLSFFKEIRRHMDNESLDDLQEILMGNI